MSEGPPSLDIREQLIRIDRAIAETQKLQNESNKFAAETREMDRDYRLSPVVAVGAALTALGSILGVVAFIMRLTGKG